MTSTLWSGAIEYLFAGIFATAILDLWALALNRTLNAPITNWGLVGRWAAGLPSGTFHHRDIAGAPMIPLEKALGWSVHYLIGITYAVLYLAAVKLLNVEPSVSSAVAFGLVTVLAPWLILQPGLGIGYFASNAPNPPRTRTLNVLSHSVFGLGLYCGSVVANLGN